MFWNIWGAGAGVEGVWVGVQREVLERGFREVQRVSEGVQRESEREAIDDDERGI